MRRSRPAAGGGTLDPLRAGDLVALHDNGRRVAATAKGRRVLNSLIAALIH